jgi:hypothetical protein
MRDPQQTRSYKGELLLYNQNLILFLNLLYN